MLSKADRYLEASVRENTSKSYASALAHFEVTWAGFLPTTTETVVRYIAEYADQLAISTLNNDLLSAWEREQLERLFAALRSRMQKHATIADSKQWRPTREKADRRICRQHHLPCPLKNSSNRGSNRQTH